MSKKEINSHMGFIDENGKLVKIPENIRKHIEAREEFWADKIKDIDIKCGIVLKRLELTNREITELEKKNDKLGTDLYNAENIVSDLQSQLAEKEKEIKELKQKLENAEHERHEEWINGKEWKWECDRLKYQLAEKEKDLEYMEDSKISFAIEQLDKVKEFCNQREKDFTYLRDDIKAISHNKWVDYIEELRFIKSHIDNKIKQLKEGK